MLHTPVLLNEVVDLMNVKPNGIYTDATAGRGGHSKEILKRLSSSGKLICIDTDIEAIHFLKDEFKNDSRVIVLHDNFKNIKNLLKNESIKGVDGILLDLGVSSPMFDDANRGFSYQHNVKLDMRMDQEQKLDAYFVVNKYDEKQLTSIFKKYGEINDCKNTVRAIINYRKNKTIESTNELVEIIKKSINPKKLHLKKHPATKYFQAIRIEVNHEIENLNLFLNEINNLLNICGRALIISFHSLEDRMVKQKFNYLSTVHIPKEVPIKDEKVNFKLINKKPIIATENEINNNYRSRSAKLRVIERIR
ncbi:MAG: 16S rRNA (cytosine(1402)-N(4))-methyltransferase RsmH [Mycoplasmataceae bacterium]|jgi:16S rRNA (cytosine1402-N4)-methyltransferase|nr:16S rRNA (cytosine(1402)-N(4))-methyltransferase RsmH [Mycoplasmataceae bacterium]